MCGLGYVKSWKPLRAFRSPKKGPKPLKMEIFNFELEERLVQYFNVKFDEESEFNSFGAEKLSRDWLVYKEKQTKYNLFSLKNFVFISLLTHSYLCENNLLTNTINIY